MLIHKMQVGLVGSVLISLLLLVVLHMVKLVVTLYIFKEFLSGIYMKFSGLNFVASSLLTLLV